MDLGLKPTTAKYQLRPNLTRKFEDPSFRPRAQALPTGDADDGGLAASFATAIAVEVELSRRSVDLQQGLGILRRASQLENECFGEEPVPPAVHLAAVELHLRKVEVMAGLGMEDEALAEARSALLRADAAWRDALLGAGTGEDLPLCASQALGRLLRKVPHWLSTAAEWAVKARMVLADRLFLIADGDPFAKATSRRPSPFVAEEEARKLQSDMAMLSDRFLSSGHPLRRAVQEAMEVDHCEVYLGEEGEVGVREEPPSALKDRELMTPPMGVLKSRLQHRPLSPEKNAAAQRAASAAELRPVKGDIFAYSLPAPKHKKVKKSSKKLQAASSTTSLPALEEAAPAYVDPFTDWKSSVVDKDKMSMVQLKIQTFEGQSEMVEQLHYQNKTFKTLDMKGLDQLGETRLYDNRTFYCGFGMRATELNRRREEAWKRKHHPPSDKGAKILQEEKEMFEQYDIQIPKGKKLSFKDLRKLLHRCHEASPIVKAQRAREAEEKRIAEEESRKAAELERQRIQRERLGGLRLGGSGEGIFSFG